MLEMRRERAISSDISDIAGTINLLVTRTIEPIDESHLQPLSSGPRAIHDLKRRIWEHFRITAARTENALLPIHRLPAEVFLLWVDHYLAVSRIDSLWDRGDYRLLQILSSVCWWWKCTLDNTPALWTRLLWRRYQSDEHAELCLSRSANYPLSIDFCLYDGTLQVFDNRILPNLWRCSTFRLDVITQDKAIDCRHAFDRFKQAQMPLLETWTLSGSRAYIPDLNIFAIHPESPLKRVDLYWWRHLSFTTPPPQTLKHLSMACVRYDYPSSLDPSQFFGILHELPAFERLEVSQVQFRSFTDTAPISLQYLKYLRLEQDCSFTLDFLKRAVLPSLQTFHVGGPKLFESYCHHVDELERLIFPLIHNALQLLPGYSPLRLAVISAPILIINVHDDFEDRIKVFFSIKSRGNPTLSFQWLNRVLQNAARPLPLHITFQGFPDNFSHRSLLNALTCLPHVRAIIVERCLDVTPLVRSLGSKSAQDCPLPELTDLVFDFINEPIDPDVVQWVRKSRSPNAPPINILFNGDTLSLHEIRAMVGSWYDGWDGSDLG